MDGVWKMKPEEADRLMKIAEKARENSYCPYSGFAVGAALLCSDGTIVKGCNIENGAYSPTNCAERTAIFTAVAQGKREFDAIAIAGGRRQEKPEVCFPCGVCRQVMSEFCKGDFRIICRNETGETESVTLDELLPRRFEFTT